MNMVFLNPHETDEDTLKGQMRQLAVETIFSYDFLLQEVRRCALENKVFIIVDESHYVDWDYSRFSPDEGPEEIKAFLLKWVGERA